MRFLNKKNAGKETCALILKTFKDSLKKRTQLSTHCQVYFIWTSLHYGNLSSQTLLSVTIMDLWHCVYHVAFSAQTFVSLSFLSYRRFISNCKVQMYANVECPHWSTQTYLVSCKSNICAIRTDWIRNNGHVLLRFFHIDSSSLMSAGHQRRHKTWQAKSNQRRHLAKHIQCFNKLKECRLQRHGMAEHTTFKAMDVAQVWDVFIGKRDICAHMMHERQDAEGNAYRLIEALEEGSCALRFAGNSWVKYITWIEVIF